MPWKETATSVTSNKSVVIDTQDALHISAFQPFLTFADANANNKKARIQSADGKLIFWTQSTLAGGVAPTVTFNDLSAPAGQLLPSAVEIHAQDGVQIVGYEPFLTLTDANAGYAKARIQSADGKLVFRTQSAMSGGVVPTVIFNDLSASAGQPLPSAVEIHAQDGVQIVGYEPFLTLTDANAGYAKARIQTANGDIVLYSKGGIDSSVPQMIIESAGDVHVTRTLKIDGDIILSNADCAEDFNIGADILIEPGTVMVISNEGGLFPSLHAYDKRVAGVISGAGDYKPGIVLDKQESFGIRQPVALLGKVYCKVDACYGAIEVGDLLTTSPTLGHAMKANDPLRAFGAVIGKALSPLAEGRGLIPILVSLQ